MGVRDLWGILSPVQRHVHLEDLKGKTLAVDLSIWVVEVQGMKQLMAVHKPHLRNVFFRAHKLLQLGILPLFVLEGDPPPLKFETMMKRAYGLAHKSGTAPPKKMGRSHFKSKLKECAEMLRYMGVPCVQSVGEAEAFCALLNKHGLVDACITEDGDAFLYGARTVYRNFTINDKDPSVEIYEMNDIELTLGLTQENLVAMALLLGCDFLPKGVPGVGREMCLKLLNSLPSVNILDRMKKWRSLSQYDIMNTKLQVKKVVHCDNCDHPGTLRDHSTTGCPLCGTSKDCKINDSEGSCPCHWHAAESAVTNRSAELAVYKKAMADHSFPHPQVIKEFLSPKDKLPPGGWTWKQPVMFEMQKYASGKLEWEEKYTQEKMLSLLSLWTQRQIEMGQNVPGALKPNRIVKCRIQKRVPVYEVEWHKCHGDETTEDMFYKTIEEQELFNRCFPNFKKEYEERIEQEAALKGKARKKKPPVKESKEMANKENEVPKKTVDDFAFNLDDYDPMSQLDLKDTLSELGLGHRVVCKEIRISTSNEASAVDEICHGLSSKLDISEAKKVGSGMRTTVPVPKRMMAQSSEVYSISSDDDDDFLPVSQLTKKSDTQRDDLFCEASGEFKKSDEMQKSDKTSDSDSDEDNLDFLPLSQRVLLKMKKGSKKPKTKPSKESDITASVVKAQDFRAEPLTNKENTVRDKCKLPLPTNQFENNSAGTKTVICTAITESENSESFGQVTTPPQDETGQYEVLNQCNKVAAKSVSAPLKSSNGGGLGKHDNVTVAFAKPSATQSEKAVKKTSKKKRMASNGRKKKNVNFDVLHGDLEMLCMDSILGDITTRNLDSSCFKEELNLQKTNMPFIGVDDAKRMHPPKIANQNTSIRTLSSKLHDLTFSDIEDEIISGAAEIFDDEAECTVLPNSSQCPAEVDYRENVNTKNNLTECFPDPRTPSHDLTVWGQDQKGNFDLGLTFDSTVIANSTNFTDSVANLIVKNMPQDIHHTIYTDSCLAQMSQSQDTLTLIETVSNDDTTVCAGATSLIVEGSAYSNQTKSNNQAASESALEMETQYYEAVSERTCDYDGLKSRVAHGTTLYEQTTSCVMGFDDFSTAPEMCTINTPNVTCIEVAKCEYLGLQNVSSLSCLDRLKDQTKTEEEETAISLTMDQLNLEDTTETNLTSDSLATVVERSMNDSTMPLELSDTNYESFIADGKSFQGRSVAENYLCLVDDTCLSNEAPKNVAKDISEFTCDNSIVELEESVQNDSELIPPSPVVLSQRLGAKLKGSQLRTLSIFSQSSQSSTQMSSREIQEVQFGVSQDDSDVVFVDYHFD